jgi:hypothetical protein
MTDVELLRRVLVDPAVGLHRAGAVSVVVDQDSPVVEEKLAGFFDSARPNEQLLLYYSGHGWQDHNNRLRLCTRDTTIAKLRTTAIRQEFISELIEDCPARAIVIILDCCFSGMATVKGGAPVSQLGGIGRFVVSSSSHAELSADAPAEGQPSPFTRHLVAGLRSAAPSRNGYVLLKDLYQYVYTALMPTGQIPHHSATGAAGDLPLARRQVVDRGNSDDEEDGERAAPSKDFEIMPVFTDPDGERSVLMAATDFTGVLHVRLPDHKTVLSTHRDAIADARDGIAVTAELRHKAKVLFIGDRAEVTHKRAVRLPGSLTNDADVEFRLPDGAGTIAWNRKQVAAFAAARNEGRWPDPTSYRATREVQAADVGDPVLRDLSRGPIRMISSVLLFAVALAVILFVRATGLSVPPGQVTSWLNFVAYGLWLLAAGICFYAMLQFHTAIRDLRYLQRMRRLARRSADATPMLMLPWDKSVQIPGVLGIPVTTTQPWVALWAPDTRDFGSPPSLCIRLHRYHRRTRAELMPEDRNPPGPRPVAVIGDPKPGRWVLIQTDQGMLWPHKRAEDHHAWLMPQ